MREHRPRKWERALIIVLTGVDGAGKSTAGRLLAQQLDTAARRAVFTTNRSGRRMVGRWSDRHDVRPPAPVLDALETAVRCINVLVSHARASVGSRIVVMDRYLYCQMALRRVRGLRPGRVLPLLHRALPIPTIVFYFDVPAEVAHLRISSRGTDAETLEHLESFATAYRELDDFPVFVVLDASRSPEQLVEDMVRALGTWVKR